MPWFPDFVSAAELARRQTRATGRADPVGRYLSALNDGDVHELETIWPSKVVVYDPHAGEIRGHRHLLEFVRRSQSLLAMHHARTKTVATTVAGDRAVVELLGHVTIDGQQRAWPVAIVAESPDDRSVMFRSYFSRWLFDGRRLLRPPILDSRLAALGDTVGRYHAALAAGDTEAVVSTFTPDGYYREPVGPPFVHRGTSQLWSFFSRCFSAGGGITLQPCAVTDDTVRCALEYNCVRWGSRDLPPQAGVAVFERGPDGLLGTEVTQGSRPKLNQTPSDDPAGVFRQIGARSQLSGKNGTMRAALYERTGPAAEVLRVEDVGRPEPGPGEVRVRLVVSGVNPTDWKSRAGVTARPIDRFQIPNQDGAGVIDAVGDGVEPSRVGERVWVWLAAAGRRWGTAAEWTVVPDQHASYLPDNASFELGASLGVPAMTAHRCLFADGGIEGLVVLVAGGAGAVGHFAIQLAKRAGARVVTTVSTSEKGKLAHAAGADAVVNYKDAGAAEQIKAFAPAVDRVIEVALASNLELDLSIVAPHAAIAAYAATADDPRLPVRECMNRNIVLRFILLYGVPEEALLWAAGDITQTLHEGRLSELPVKRFSLEDIAAAHEAVEAGFPGKVLVDLT